MLVTTSPVCRLLCKTHLQKWPNKEMLMQQPGANLQLPVSLPPSVTLSDSEARFTTVTAVKCRLSSESSLPAKPCVFSAVISHTSPAQWKACCCLPPERGVALRWCPPPFFDWQMKRRASVSVAAWRSA